MPRKVSKLPELEGLRGIAAFCVVLTHLHLTFFITEIDALERWFQGWAGGVGFVIGKIVLSPLNGSFCVWVFWVMSALVLSCRFFETKAEPAVSLRRTYLLDASLRRYPRLLLPVLAAVLFGYALCRMGAMHNVELANFLGEPYRSGWLSGFYTFVPSLPDAFSSAFWNTFFSFRQPSQYDPPLWTMKRELIGSYFLFGFLAVVGNLRGRWLIYPALALLVLFFRQHWINAFLAGIAMCDLRVNAAEVRTRFPGLARRFEAVRPYLGWAVLVAAGVLFCVGLVGERADAEKVDNPVAFFYAVLASVAVLLVQVSRPMKRLFSRRIPVYLGKISFGMYICHFPIIMSFSAWFYLRTVASLGHLPAALVTSALTLVLSVVVGHLFYVLADRPSLPFSRALAAAFMAGLAKIRHLIRPGHRAPEAS